MSARRRQSGQALVAALVTLALLFALAGGLAVAVSAALGAQASVTAPSLRDAAATSAGAAVISRVAGPLGDCPSGQLFGDVGTYSCNRVDVITPAVAAMVPLRWQGACSSAALAPALHSAVWLNSVQRLASVYVDGSAGGCSPSAGACVASETHSGPAYFYSIPDCPTAAFGTAYAHATGPSGAASVVRTAAVAALLPGPGSPYGVGLRPGPVIAARLRGAGGPLDLVVGNRAGATISVLLGRGDGTFAPAVSYPLPGGVSDIAVGDLGNGTLDVAAVSLLSSTLTVYLGRGDGTFYGRRDYLVGQGLPVAPSSVAIGAFTGRDAHDVAVASLTARSLTILSGNGGGQLSRRRSYLVDGGPTAVAPYDTGAAWGAYLAVATARADLATYRVPSADQSDQGDQDGDQGGGLTGPPKRPLQVAGGPYPLSGTATALGAGSFTGAGLDLAALVPAAGQVEIFLGLRGGRLSDAGPVAAGSLPAGIATGSFGGAGAGLAISGAAGTVTVLRGNGDGTFRAVPGGQLATGAGPLGVAAGPFDGGPGDGLAVANGGDGTVTVLLPNRSRVFSIVAGPADRTAFNESDVVWADREKANRLFFEDGLS